MSGDATSPGASSTLPRVYFYHLGSTDAAQIDRFCCRLVDKAWQLGNRVCILTDDAERALDDFVQVDRPLLRRHLTREIEAGRHQPRAQARAAGLRFDP